MTDMFEGKTLMVTGGTGSFGNAVVKRMLKTGLKEIRVFSRDEKKQDDMRKLYRNDRLKFIIGDVRDYRRVAQAMKGVDFVFHAAALKQVPSCEVYPMEAVKTNVLGSCNVLDAAIEAGVKKVIVLSTDKAAYPINAMGISKAMMERVATAKGLEQSDTIICRTRYGNVMASRGSAIPLFCNQVDSGEPITITDPTMSRYMMTLEDAVDLVLYAFRNGEQGDLFVQKAPAATVPILAEAIQQLKGKHVGTVDIGIRDGEKLYEVLVTREEMARAVDCGGYYRVRPYGMIHPHADEYNSMNTHQLDVEGMKALLKKLTLFGGTT